MQTNWKELDEVRALVKQAQSRKPNRRQEAVRQLADAGDSTVPALCQLLKHHNFRVREDAAVALGEVGDARAIEPLLDALRECFVVRTPWLRVVLGILLIPLLALASVLSLAAIIIVAIVFLFIAVRLGSLWEFGWLGEGVGEWLLAPFKWLWKGVTGPFEWLHRKRSQRTCEIIARSLSRIAERHPTPELRNALPDLALVTADFALQSEESRQSAREAVDLIDRLTSKVQSLPRSALQPATATETLPATADSRDTPLEDLPRSAQDGAVRADRTLN